MKKLVLVTVTLCILGFISCISNSTKSHATPKEEYNNMSYDVDTYINTFKDSKNRPHKVIVFKGYKCVTSVDLDANTYK